MNTTTQYFSMGDAVWKWHATAHETGGLFSLGEAIVRPGGEPPPHVHSHEDEAMYVLDGSLDFVVGGDRRSASAGDLVLMPRGIEHGFTVLSPQARILLMCTPGGVEQAFIEVSEPVEVFALADGPAGPPPPEAVEAFVAVFAESGVAFTLPQAVS